MARAASLTGQFERFGRGDGWCFDVGLSQMGNRWLVRGVREREVLGLCALRFAARCGRGARMAMGVDSCRADTFTRACLDNDKDAVVLIVTGAVEFVACPVDGRVRLRLRNSN